MSADSLPSAKRLEAEIAIASLDYLREVAAGLNRPLNDLTAADILAWAGRDKA